MLNSSTSPPYTNASPPENNPSIQQNQSFSYNPHQPYDPSFFYSPPYPEFSSQCSIGVDESQTRSDDANQLGSELPKSARSTKRSTWSIDEDKVLVSAYLNISKDSIVGTDQSGASFWKRVAEYYDNYKKGSYIRDAKACKNRFHLVNGMVSKFVGAYSQASARKKSGESESDVLLAAHKIYESDGMKRFNLDHVWYLLKDDPKWRSVGEGSGSKRMKNNEYGSYTSSSSQSPSSGSTTPTTPNTATSQFGFGDIPQPENIRLRPIGVKAAKRKAKAKAHPMPSVAEGIPKPIANMDEAEADKRAMVTEYMKTKKMMATTISDKVRMKKLMLYSKLAHMKNITEEEKELKQFLKSELFP